MNQIDPIFSAGGTMAIVNNAALYYELTGDPGALPIVLIHAGVADHRQWNNEFESLAQHYRVLRYDLRGYGRSLPVAGQYRHLNDLVTLLAMVGITRPAVLVGCSMGGGLATEFALAYPERTRALVLVGSAPGGLELDAPGHPLFAEAEAAYRAGDLDRLAELETQIWFDGMGRSAEAVDPLARQLAYEMNRLALAHEATGLGERLPDATEPAATRLADLTLPLLVIVGEYDLPYLRLAADYMREKLPQVQHIVLPDAAHLPNMDQPTAFAAVLNAFLATLG